MIRMRVIARERETESGKDKVETKIKKEEGNVQRMAAAAIHEHQTPIRMIIASFLLRRGQKCDTSHWAGRRRSRSSSRQLPV